MAQINLSELSIEQLKALAYDLMVDLNTIKGRIEKVENIIAMKSQNIEPVNNG